MASQDDNTRMPLVASGSTLGRLIAHNDVAFALGLALVLATLLIPLPTFLLDLLLSCSIAISIATLVIVLSARESIEFSTFPSLLLFVTLYRLSINVASTRLILTQGDAGKIIQTFGTFVLGGPGGVSTLVIGLVVFLILVVIQFIVITKGAERISEVAARFNLDAMPGKQMAIDADLNTGIIGEEEARARRQKIVRESEFYGSMDGASKFIRGDAVASLIIVAINLIGGIIVGLTEGTTVTEAVRRYSILAIGDGLVTQIPAVIISTSSGFLISKTSTQNSLSTDLVRQMLSRSRPLWIASFLLGAMVFVPGFPSLPFVFLAVGTAAVARALGKGEQEARKKQQVPKREGEAEQAAVEELLDVDQISIHVGARLISVVDPRRKSSLSNRIVPLRRKFAQQYGLILPLVRLRDNVALEPSSYEIRLHNHAVGTGKLEPELFLAMDPGTVSKTVQGLPAREPVFNLPALWVRPDKKEEAELNGYTVIDPESVLITHLSETLKKYAYELLTRDDVQKLVDRLREKQPALVGSIVSETVCPIGLLHRILQNLLKDGIPVRDLAKTLEAVGDLVGRTKDPATLTEHVRKALARTITEQHLDNTGRIAAIVMEPSLEYELRSGLKREADGELLSIAPDRAIELGRRIVESWKSAMEQGCDRVVMLCDGRLRPHLAGMLGRQLPQLPVVAYDEIVPGTRMESVATVSLESPELALAGPTG